MIHKLIFFHRLHYNNPPLPSYVTDLSTDPRQDATGRRLRNAQALSIPFPRLVSFQRSYIPATISLWNQLPESFKNTPSHREFARLVWQRFGAPEPPTLFSVGQKSENMHHTRLRVGLSTLHAHLFKIQHPNTPSPSCTCGHLTEDTNHFILRCPLYNNQRQQLLRSVRTILPGFDNLTSNSKLDILLFGKTMNENDGICIAQYLHTYIHHTHRFDPPP